jgi:hypothetical protein
MYLRGDASERLDGVHVLDQQVQAQLVQRGHLPSYTNVQKNTDQAAHSAYS